MASKNEDKVSCENEVNHAFPMLPFEKQIFMEIVENDGLIVAAKGLSLDHVLLNFFKLYADRGNLVIVLNCPEFDERYYIERLNDNNVHATTFTTNTTERTDVYLSGGIHFITTRILVVDLLKKRIPIDKITGIVVLQAHNVLEHCQEAFVLRLFRHANKTGFIKAFTHSAQSFTIGFGHVERIMRALFVKHLYIWPRFHSTVIQSLKPHEPHVLELHIPISEQIRKLQTCILDLMNLSVKELKNINKGLELVEMTVENCLTKQFHKVLQSQLNCVWHQLSSKSKQLISELKTLRHLLILLFYNDVVTFYAALLTCRSREYAESAHWVFLQPAQLLFTEAACLVYDEEKKLKPQFCSKWETLTELLKVEIANEIQTQHLNGNECKVLILCEDSKTCFQLNQFLTHGPQHYLFLMALSKGISFKSISKEFETPHCKELQESFMEHSKCEDTSKQTKKKPKTNEDVADSSKYMAELEELESMRDTYILKMSQTVLLDSTKEQQQQQREEDEDTTAMPATQVAFEACPDVDNLNLTQIIDTLNQPTVLIQTFKTADSFLSLQKTLVDMAPSFIIMYHSTITAVRQIELYEARRKKISPLKVYFLIHAETIEEQSYLTSLRKEKEAFEFLIDTKSTMIVPEDQDGRTDECLALQREMKSVESNTRKAGGMMENSTMERNFIIVDMREFRSDLPALIHKRGIEIEPLTITVGDYVITRDICVERKSVSDLIGSLNSGRLYQQCTQMTRAYAKPMLLIEFDQTRGGAFTWHSNQYMISDDAASFNTQQKLLLLTMHFPRLKIIWSPSPYASAQLFEELKEGKEQPSVQFSMSVGADGDADTIEMKYNTGIYDFVQKLPGINSKNIDALMRQCDSLDHVANFSCEQLQAVLGCASNAESLFSIMNKEQSIVAENNKQGKASVRSKFKFHRK